MTCVKRRYRDRVAALLALSKITRLDDAKRAKIPGRVYRCPQCGGWHLTSQTRRRTRPAEPA